MSWLPWQRQGVVSYHDSDGRRITDSSPTARAYAGLSGQPGPRIAVLADSAISEDAHRAASQALRIAVSDLDLTAIPRTLAWFDMENGANAGTISRHLLGYVDAPTAAAEICAMADPGRLRGFVLHRWGQHGTLFIRRNLEPLEAAGVVLHEACHSFQIGQTFDGLRDSALHQAEADAQAYSARMLPQVSAVARVSPYEQRQIVMGRYR